MLPNMTTTQSVLSPAANPYSRPVLLLVGQIQSVEWVFPFLPQFIQTVVLCLVITLLAILYITIGIISQISGVFTSLILHAREQMPGGSSVERSAQIVCIGVYWLLRLPFWLVERPFAYLGELWAPRLASHLPNK